MKLSIFSMNRPGSAPAPEEPPELPPAPDDSQTRPVASLQELRQRLLGRILQASSILGALILLANLPTIPLSRLAVYVLLVGFLFFITFNPRLNYTLRAAVLVVIFYSVGLVILLIDGIFGVGPILLIAIPIFAALLSGFYSRVASLVISLGTLVIVGLLMNLGVIPSPQPDLSTSQLTLLYWATAVITFALLAVAATISSGVILEGLERSMERQNSLTLALRRERSALEERVQQRTTSLERRLLQIRTAAEIIRANSRTLNIDQLLPQVCELMRQRFDLYYVGIFLIEESRPGQPRYAALAAGSGEAGQRMLADKHRLLVGGDSMIGWATANRQSRIALDVGKEAVRFNNPNLPHTRSELALPIIAGQDSQGLPTSQTPEPVWGQGRRADPAAGLPAEQGRVVGAITIQSQAEAAFDQDDILVMQGIADGLANALENARLFAVTQASLEEVRGLHRQYLEGAWAEQIETSGEMDVTFEAPGQAEASADERAWIETPLRLRDQVIGSVRLEAGESAGSWGADQKALVEAVATQAALALENARLLEETRRRADQERATSEISSKLWTSSDMDAILRTVLKELGGKLNLSEGWLELWPETSDQPNREASHVDN